MGVLNGSFTLLKLRPAESFSLGRSSCSWASKMSTSCSISRTEELTSPAKMGPLVCLANSLAKLAAFSPLRICEGRGEISFQEDARKRSPQGISQSNNTRYSIMLQPQKYMKKNRYGVNLIWGWYQSWCWHNLLIRTDQTGRSHAAVYIPPCNLRLSVWDGRVLQ